MVFSFNTALANGYHGATQIARVLTEDWVERNVYCPCCGNPVLRHFEANRPVADFICDSCCQEYELKSKERNIGIGKKIADGEYNTLLSRIQAYNNPNFLFLTHSNAIVKNCILIPNHFFVPSIIEKRKPLSPTARRAGWIGCNINLTTIPEYGKMYIVKDSVEIEHETVISNYKAIESLRTDSIDGRGWLMDVLLCTDKLGNDFTLNDMYSFAPLLRTKHPNNKHIEPKIRQQLQFLRDKGFIEFISPGHYRKTNRVL